MATTCKHATWALAALLAAAGCLPRSPADQRARRAARGTGEVTVVAAWPWQRRTELRYRDGLTMALEEVNASGGVNGRPLRLRYCDDDESVDQATIMAHQIAVDPEVMAVIGHLQSFVTVPVAPIYEMAGLLLISPTATDPTLTARGYQRVFRTTFADQDTGHQLAEYAQGRFRRMAIYYIRNDYGRGLANAFEERASELGVVIAARRSYDPGEQVNGRSFAPTLREWKSLELDAVFLAGEVPSAAHFVVQARADGLDVPMIGGDAMSSPALISVAGRAAEGLIVTSFFHPDEPRAEVQQFKEAFRRRFAAPPDGGAAVGYDNVWLLARAMRQARSVAPDQVARALHAFPPWSGVTGRFQFDANGAPVGRRLVKMVVRSGKFEYLGDERPVATDRPR
jgi:branched-chain amino acid transport system substrate-binding protein